MAETSLQCLHSSSIVIYRIRLVVVIHTYNMAVTWFSDTRLRARSGTASCKEKRRTGYSEELWPAGLTRRRMKRSNRRTRRNTDGLLVMPDNLRVPHRQ